AARRGLQTQPTARVGARRALSGRRPRYFQSNVRAGSQVPQTPSAQTPGRATRRRHTMDASNRDALSAVVARQRGRGRLRSATVALGAASLVAAGAIAYALPSGVTHTATTTAGPAAAGGSSAHATSGGSGVAAATSSGTGSASAPTASSGTSHATSGGS